MKFRALIILTIVPIALVNTLLVAPIVASASQMVGDGTALSCNDTALSAAIGRGGSITFSCGPAPKVISVHNPMLIALDTTEVRPSFWTQR